MSLRLKEGQVTAEEQSIFQLYPRTARTVEALAEPGGVITTVAFGDPQLSIPPFSFEFRV